MMSSMATMAMSTMVPSIGGGRGGVAWRVGRVASPRTSGWRRLDHMVTGAAPVTTYCGGDGRRTWARRTRARGRRRKGPSGPRAHHEREETSGGGGGGRTAANRARRRWPESGKKGPMRPFPSSPASETRGGRRGGRGAPDGGLGLDRDGLWRRGNAAAPATVRCARGEVRKREKGYWGRKEKEAHVWGMLSSG